MTTLNLHGIVRGAINANNSDIVLLYLASTGNRVLPGGKQVPGYALPVRLMGQVQPITQDKLEHYSFVNAQGLYRRVYAFGQQNAIDRIVQLGGDLLQFAEVPGGIVRTWLVKACDEQWPGWCNLVVVLQLDPANPK